MDSDSQLDYALFQLTPTRTRCDLVICTGDSKEKIASGTVQPFITHLKFVKDEISKGGYSVTLAASAPWFTKSTLEKFVRFVSTPEVLERFISIEREIANIDSSMNTNASSDSQSGYELDELSNKSANLTYKHEGNTSDAVHEEDSKVHLQRVLETRKTVLQREQAMVYARALIAGFEMDNLQDLICFADAFGSPRLRESCINFIELCNRKSHDRVWMDEVVAMQAYSRSHYSYTEDDSGQGLRINIRNGNFTPKKQNGSVDSPTTDSSLSQYMHTYQTGPMFQPPYQGYPFPGIAVPPFYQENLPWSQNVEDSRSRRKRSHKKGSRDMTLDGNVDSSDLSSGSESERFNKTSSRKVVIRNINYITSARNGKTERENNGNSSNNDVDKGKTFEDKHEGQKVTQQWDIFQNLLMKDSDENESDQTTNIIPSEIRPDKAIQEKSQDIFEDDIKSIRNTKHVSVNDPLAVQAQSFNQSSDSQLKTRDILMVSESNQTQNKVEDSQVNEPNDLYMVLERDTSGQQAVPAWTPEMESGNSNLKIIKQDSVEDNKSTKSRTKTAVTKGIDRKGSTIEAKSKAMTRLTSKKSSATKTTMPKGKSEKEEEKRKKMEELLAQRQKRIAERSASATKMAKTDKPKPQLASQDKKKSNKPILRSSTIDRLSVARVVNPKVLSTESKPGNKPMKAATKKNGEPKPGNKPMKAATKTNGEPKPGNRPMKATAKKTVVPKPVTKPTRVTTKENVFSRTSLSKRTAGAENKKVKPAIVKPLDKSMGSKNLNGPKKMITDAINIKQLPKASPIKKIGNRSAQSADTKGVKEILPKTSSVRAKDKAVSNGNGGSANKALNSVSFSLNEENGGKQNPVVKVNRTIPVKEISPQPPVKVSGEENNSKKKWNNLQTTSKALSGFRKLLSFGRRN